MTIRYIFREGDPVRIKSGKKASPQKIGEALARISEAGAGRLTPKAVVDAARSPTNPLHRHFEWDDSKAAQAYRLEQAREIISIVRVADDETQDGTTRAFLSVNDGKGVSYRTIGEIKGSVKLQLAMLTGAERELEGFERRYRDLVDVCNLVRAARTKIVARKKEYEEQRAAA